MPELKSLAGVPVDEIPEGVIAPDITYEAYRLPHDMSRKDRCPNCGGQGHCFKAWFVCNDCGCRASLATTQCIVPKATPEPEPDLRYRPSSKELAPDTAKTGDAPPPDAKTGDAGESKEPSTAPNETSKAK